MSKTAMWLADSGEERRPSTPDEWAQWVSATAVRGHILGDPILDWFDLYGESRGFARDDESPSFDPRTDFTTFIFEQGHLFEAAVVAELRKRTDVLTVVPGEQGSRDLTTAEQTFDAMVAGTPVIHQAVLRDPQHRTYGTADLLVRSDVLRQLFPDAISEQAAAIVAPDFPGFWHYRVVDVKFTTLHLLVSGEMGNAGSAKAYKGQVFIYNRALGRLQGYEPPEAFLLGRGWEQTIKRETYRGVSCMERLAPVPMSGTVGNKVPISTAVAAACQWVDAVRTEGMQWNVLPAPDRVELFPNFTNTQDGPWHAAKKSLAEQLQDVTLLWQVGIAGREEAHAHSIYRWTDPHLTPALVGVTGAKRAPVLQALLDINRTSAGPVVLPARITAGQEGWREEPPLEFYVDFETVNDLADDFTRMPHRGGQSLIFMIGCGHVERGEWQFECFVADALTEDAEASIIDAWFAHMSETRDRVAPRTEPPVIHWSPAEVSTLENAYNSAKERHEDRSWPSPAWFDFLGCVMREQPVVIRGAMGFGLKAVAKALHSHGLIQTLWGDGPTDGLGAMMGSWWAYGEAGRLGVPVPQLELMQQVVAYNEVDCRVMMEAVRYFRSRH